MRGPYLSSGQPLAAVDGGRGKKPAPHGSSIPPLPDWLRKRVCDASKKTEPEKPKVVLKFRKLASGIDQQSDSSDSEADRRYRRTKVARMREYSKSTDKLSAHTDKGKKRQPGTNSIALKNLKKVLDAKLKDQAARSAAPQKADIHAGLGNDECKPGRSSSKLGPLGRPSSVSQTRAPEDARQVLTPSGSASAHPRRAEHVNRKCAQAQPSPLQRLRSRRVFDSRRETLGERMRRHKTQHLYGVGNDDDSQAFDSSNSKVAVISELAAANSTFIQRLRRNIEEKPAEKVEVALDGTAQREAAAAEKRRMSCLDRGILLSEGENMWIDVFMKIHDDGQIHHDDLLHALELAGFIKPEPGWVEDVYHTVTKYSSLSADDFVIFIRGYKARQKQAMEEAFKQCDVDNSGEVEKHELRDLLRQFGIEPMRHVLDEVFAECDADCKGTLDLEEFENVMEMIRVREGFTKKEYEELMYVYSKFDFDQSGEIDTQELTGILGWLGYVCDLEIASDVMAEVDVDGSGTLNPREYLMCMRKVREREISKIMHFIALSDADGSGSISKSEMFEVATLLGYMPDPQALEEAALDSGVEDLEHMDLSAVWLLLSIYRAREGFTVSETVEIQEAFAKFDVECRGEISTIQMGKLLRWLGYALPFEVAQHAAAKVDVNRSGLIDLPELRKMMRINNESERRQIQDAFSHCDESGAGRLSESDAAEVLLQVSAVESCGIIPENLKDLITQELDDLEAEGRERMLDMHSLVSILERAKREMRQHFRDNVGFSPRELLDLKTIFKVHDTGHQGAIGKRELIRLLETMFPRMARSKHQRPRLLQIMQRVDVNGDGSLGFQEFLKLNQMFREVRAEEKFFRERRAMEMTRFTPPEVEGFRELFLGSSMRRLRMTFQDLKELINGLVPLGDKFSNELAKHFRAVDQARVPSDMITPEPGALDFPDFLVLMRRLLQANFGNIRELASMGMAGELQLTFQMGDVLEFNHEVPPTSSPLSQAPTIPWDDNFMSSRGTVSWTPQSRSQSEAPGSPASPQLAGSQSPKPKFSAESAGWPSRTGAGQDEVVGGTASTSPAALASARLAPVRRLPVSMHAMLAAAK